MITFHRKRDWPTFRYFVAAGKVMALDVTTGYVVDTNWQHADGRPMSHEDQLVRLSGDEFEVCGSLE